MRALCRLSLLVALTTGPSLFAQNCSNTSIGEVPLLDLGSGTYQGFAGGLYGNGQNTPPAAHLAVGLTRMAAVQPRDAAGAPTSGGRIVLLSIGMSNTSQEFSQWQQVASSDPNRNPAVTIVNGAQGGQDAVTIANAGANFWNVVDQRLAAAGVTPAQVQVVWLKQAIAGVSGGFPGAAVQLQGLLAQIVAILHTRYANLQLCFCSSRTYAGYAVTTLNPEPYAYESGFSVQWLLAQQMGGDPTLNADPNAGAVTAPWLGFGPYLWADGTTPRADGLTWTCADVLQDGTHPSALGRQKIAGLLQDFFVGDPLASPWYVATGGAATFVLYGNGCGGALGVPGMRSNGLPSIGNSGFRVGVDEAAAQALAGLWFSDASAALPIVGSCQLVVDPAPGLPLMVAITNGNGAAQIGVPVPMQPALVGAQLFAQWLVNDPTATPLAGLFGLAVSRGAHLTVGL